MSDSSSSPDLDRRNFLTALAAGGVAGSLAGTLATRQVAQNEPDPVDKKEPQSVFEKLRKTGKLECGYNFWEPGLFMDEKAGELRGFVMEVVREIERYTKVEFDMATVIDWGNIASDLNTGKIDIMCAGMWNAVEMAKHMLFTRPISFQTLEAIVRADDNRFDNNLAALNSASVKIAVIDNADTAYIAENEFPKARRISMPMLASDAEMLLNVSTGKADVMFTNPGIAHGYMKNNPGKVKRAAPGQALRVYGNTLVIAGDEQELANFLNLAIDQLINMGKIDSLIDKYNAQYPDTFLKPQKRYLEAA